MTAVCERIDFEEILGLIPGYDPFATAGDCRFDAEAAQNAIDFFMHPEDGCLRHVKGALAGTLLRLEPWQQAIIANIFGWKRPDGTRRYREVFIFIPRKNGKTTLAAGIANYVLFCDGEPGAELYCAAADRDQALLVFEQAKGMIFNEPALEARAKVYTASKAIVNESEGSSLKAISADANTKHGYNTHLAIIDELHAQPNRDLVDVLMTSTGSRRQPLIIHITTADFDRESICNEKRRYALKVRDGVIDDPYFLPVIYEASLEDDWTDPAVWASANPNLGVSVSLEYLERECRRAQETPTFENTFKRLHLNITTQQDVRWLRLEDWDRCAGAVDAEALKGKECFAGLDLSTTTDLSAFVLFFPEGNLVLPFFWIPEDNAHERERRDRVPYLTWAREGFVQTTPGNVIDYDFIRRRIKELGQIYNIREIAVDRWNSTQLQTQLQGDGFTIVPFGQGFASMSAPTKELEKLIIGGALAHGAHPVLRWNASNVSVETDAAGNLKPSKKKSTERIDGIVALIMALGRAMVREEGGSVYDGRGILLV